MERIKNKLSKPGIYAFFGSFLAGFFTHLFIFTNIIPNSDGIGKVFDQQQMTVSGRWFLHYASMFHKYIQAPALIGFLSLVFLSAAAYMTVDLLSMKNRYAALGVGVLAAVFPASAYTYVYTFTASAYFFGLFLAVAGVWFAVRFRFGFLPGAVLLALSAGTYQSYFAAAAVLSFVFYGKYITENNSEVRDILKTGARLLGFGILGAVIYYVILKIMLAVKDLTLLSYRDMDSFSILSLPGQWRFAYRDFYGFFLKAYDPCRYSTPLLVCLNVLLLALAVFFIAVRVIRSKAYKSPVKMILLAVLILLFPVAADLSAILVSGKSVTVTMRYSFAFALMIPLAASDGCEKVFKKAPAFLLSVLLAVGVLGSSLYYVQTDNIVYTSLATAHRASESFCTRLVLRVESLEGYETGMPVYIIGTMPTNIYHNDTAVYSLTADYTAPKDSVLELNKHVYYYLNGWLNVPWQKPAEEDMIAVSDSDTFKNMPLYPADGSVVISEGKVIVKLAEAYTPMSDFEKQYENRR